MWNSQGMSNTETTEVEKSQCDTAWESNCRHQQMLVKYWWGDWALGKQRFEFCNHH